MEFGAPALSIGETIMSQEVRRSWDERFRAGDRIGTEPDPFLAVLDEYRSLLPESGQVLDVACGAGRNAVWLAQKPWSVTGCDISMEGLRKARGLASERGVTIDLVCADLENAPPFRVQSLGLFDLILCFFYLERSLFPFLKAALRPGGLIVYKTYTVDQKRIGDRPMNKTHLLEPQELLHAFQDFRVLYYQELVSGRRVAQMIAQKKEDGKPRSVLSAP
jgi:tellurite methyltransferase